MSELDKIADRNNYKGIIISVALHIVLLLLFLWVTVWKEPYPPNPEIGIELNFGLSDSGSGEEAVANEELTESEEVEEVVEEQSEAETELPNEAQETPTETENSESNDQSEVVATQEEGLVEEKSQQSTKEVVPNEAKKEDSKKAVEQPKEEKKPETNPNALFPGNNKSQGDTQNSGDQGVKDGDVNADALMGPQGGGNGSKLEMSGWAWEREPNPDDQSDQNGKIVFEIKVDDNGEVINVRPIQTTVSPDVVRVYQNEVQKLRFYKTSGGTSLNTYTGKITFIIRSK